MEPQQASADNRLGGMTPVRGGFVVDGALLSGFVGVKERLLSGPFDFDRVLDSLEFSEPFLGGKSLPPRFEGGEVVEVNHEVTRSCGWPEDLKEAVVCDAVAVPEVKRHVGKVLTSGRSLTSDNVEPSVHPVDAFLLALAPRLLVEPTRH